MTRKYIHEEFMKYFTKLFTHLSFFIYSLVYVVEEYWRICKVYVTVYCLKFYIILTKFKSVWIYRKLWRILNNRMTLNAIEIWNLNRFKRTYKHENIKNQKQRKKKRVFYEYSWWKSTRWIHKVIIMECKTDICFDKCNRKNYNMKTCKLWSI